MLAAAPPPPHTHTHTDTRRTQRPPPPLPRRRSVEKSNVLEVSQLWREVVTRVGEDYPEVELSHM